MYNMEMITATMLGDDITAKAKGNTGLRINLYYEDADLTDSARSFLNFWDRNEDNEYDIVGNMVKIFIDGNEVIV